MNHPTGDDQLPSRESDDEVAAGSKELALGAETEREVGSRVLQKLFGGDRSVRQFGRYQVERRLGQGAMGKVYLARDPDLDRAVAIKVLHAGLGAARSALVREARAMARLHHPNVVGVYDVGEHEEQIFVAMERVSGHSLREWLDEQPRSWRSVTAVFRDAARGLAAAHEAGVIHRDFKPDNALVGDDGRVAVMDFGLAHFDADQAAETMPQGQLPEDATLSTTHRLSGTPAYMAPEVIGGGPSTAASDQFGFFVALHEGLYGVRPFSAPTVERLLLEISDGQRQPPPAGTPVPGRLAALIARGLQVDPERRHPSMTAVADALERALVPLVRRMVVPIVGVAVLGSAIGGAVAYDRLQHRDCDEQGDRIDEVWSAEARKRVRGTMLAAEYEHADPQASWTSLETRLDDWSEAWKEQRRQACRGQAEDRWPARRTDCSQTQLLQLSGLVEVLSVPGEGIAEHAMAAANQLPSPAQCADDKWVSTGVVAPPPAEHAESVAAAREQLARASALHSAGQFEPAMAAATPPLELARLVDYPPLTAHALNVIGQIHDALGDYAAAEQALLESFDIATEVDAPSISANSSVRLGEIIGFRLGRPREGRHWLRMARGSFERLGDTTEEIAIGRLKVLARMNSDLGETDAALATIHEARERARANLPADSSIHTSVMGTEAAIMGNSGDRVRATELLLETIARNERIEGAEHPSMIPHLMNLFVNYAETDRLDDAEAVGVRVLALNEKLFGPMHPGTISALGNLASLTTAQGDAERGAQLLEQTLERSQEVHGPDHFFTRRTRGNLALTQQHLGNYDAALEQQTALLAAMDTEGDDKSRTYAELLSNQATSLIALERSAEAKTVIERALAIQATFDLPPGRSAAMRLTLARARWELGERASAVTLAREAMNDAADPADAAARESISGWLAEHQP